MKLVVSVGVIAFNEEKNIARLLKALLTQKLRQVTITQIIVISSGSTDNTNRLVRALAKKYPLVRLFTQKHRLGKASAVNLFLAKAKHSLVVLMSADLLPQEQTVEKLVLPLVDKHVGIVGARPVPLNSQHTFMGYAAHLLWRLHHEISLRKPKMGEMIAFRKIFEKIPESSSVDEANIEPLIRGQGYLAVYVPRAVVYNKGPASIKEFIARRRHIYFGHLAAKYDYSYEVSTFSSYKILLIMLQHFHWSWKTLVWAPAIIALEAYSRLLGYLDYRFKLRTHTIWHITPSTKDLARRAQLRGDRVNQSQIFLTTDIEI